MGDYGDFAVAAAVFDNKPLDLTRDGFAFIICIVRRVERYALGRIVEFIGKFRAAEGSLFEKAKLIVKEMTDLLVLDLVDKGLVTDQIVLTVGYDIENLTNP